MDVRRYSEDGPGEVKLDHLPDYPRRVPGTVLHHTVESLGNAFALSVMCWLCQLCVEVVYLYRG